MVKHFVMQPLPTSFMFASILGFLISALVVWNISITWGFTFTMFFAILFLASVYNFTHAEGVDHLDIHDSDMLARRSNVKPK